MARISTYLTDDDINVNDRLVGSEQYIDSGVIKFRTKNYKVGDLATFFGISVGAVNTYLGSFDSSDNFTYSSAFATQVTTTTAAQGFAAATDVTTLTATVTSNKATTDASAVTLTQAIADEESARASADTSLNTRVNIILPSGGTTVSSSFANSVLSTSNSGLFATAAYAQNLGSSFGTVANDGSITISNSFANSVLSTSNSGLFATSQFVQNLGGSFGSVAANGTVTISQSAADTILSTANTSNLATASSVTQLDSAIKIKPNIFRQDDAPAVSGNPQQPPDGSIWYDTNDNNVVYVLVSGSWTKTTDERLSDTIVGYLATATENLSTTSTSAGASATKITNLGADFGSFDGSNNFTPSLSATATNEITAKVTGTTAFTTAVNTIRASQAKIFNQSSAPAVTEPVNSIWIDSDDGKNYVLTSGSPNTWVYSKDAALDQSASVTTFTQAFATIDNKFSATHALTVNAGGAIAGMKLLADNTTGSEIRFQADKFKIQTGGDSSSTEIVPFAVSGTTVTMQNVVIDGNVTIGGTAVSTVKSGAASGATANQSSNATIRAVGAATSGTIAGISISGSELYQGAGTFGNANTGFYLGSNGTFSLKDKLTWNGTTLTINGNGTFSGDLSAASGSFSGLLSGNTGNIGGWIISNTTLSSNDTLLSLDSSSNSIIIKDSSGNTKVEITGSSSVTNPANVGSLGQTSNGSIPASVAGTISSTGSSVTLSASSSTVAVLTSSGEVAPFQNKTLTVKATLNGIAFNLSSSVGTGSAVGKFGIAVYNSSSSSTPIAISDFVTVTATGSTSGNVSIPSNTIKSVSVTVGPSDTVLYVRAYFGGGSLVHPNFGTSKSVTFNRPALTSVDIAPNVNKVEVSSGGMLVAASASQFFTLDKSSNTRANPFIRSKGFMEHQGRLTVLNASGTPGTGDIYLGGTDNDSSGYMRIFSVANSHKYIDWGDGTSNSAVQLKLRYNGNQKFQFSSTGVFDANSTKNFKINHLLESKKETHYLRHAAIEGPKADLIYRGKVTLSNGTAVVNIDEVSRMSDGTFSLLCRDIQCFTSNETGWDAVRASVSNNTLTINCQNTNSSDEISWMVIAERKDPSYIDSDVTDDNGLYKTESEKED